MVVVSLLGGLNISFLEVAFFLKLKSIILFLGSSKTLTNASTVTDMLSFTLVVDLDALLIFSKEQNLLLEDNRWHFIQDAQE